MSRSSRSSIVDDFFKQTLPWDLTQAGVGEELMLERWFTALQNKLPLIEDIYRVTQYNDEPKMQMFHASVAIDEKEKYFGLDGEGFSFESANLAMLKCLGEAAERISNFFCHQPTLALSLSEVVKLKQPFLDPRTVLGVWEKNWPEKKKITWTLGWDIQTWSSVLIPAQLVWLNEKSFHGEPVILPPISTGAASHSSATTALSSGIFEYIERDAYMLSYLQKLPCPRIDLTNDPELKALENRASRYNLELVVLETTTDIPIPSFVALVIDRSGNGPAVTVGLNAHLDAKTAIYGAIEEAFHPRSWLRAKHAEANQDSGELNNLEQRGLYWYDVSMIHHLDFWLKNKTPRKQLSDFTLPKQTAPQQIFVALQKQFQKHHQRAYAINIAHPELAPLDLTVIKMVMPDLHPLHLQEKFICRNSPRLSIPPEKLNTTPHPFL